MFVVSAGSMVRKRSLVDLERKVSSNVYKTEKSKT